MKATQIRIHSIRPVSGQTLVRVSLCGGLGLLPSRLDQYPNPMQIPRADLWDCNCEDQVSPGGGSV